jgi:hypothetical protein
MRMTRVCGTRITEQSNAPVSVPNLHCPVIARLPGRNIHRLLVSWTFDLSASADFFIGINKEQGEGGHVPRSLVVRHSGDSGA